MPTDNGITSRWIALKLDIDPSEVRLFIEADLKGFLNRSRDERRELADKVEYLHPQYGVIMIGPKNIIAGNRIITDSGYESRDFKDFVSKNSSRYK